MGKVWSRSAQSPLALGVGTAVGVFLLATAYRRIKRVDDKAEPGECKAELNKQDKFMILSGEPPVTTITWFRCVFAGMDICINIKLRAIRVLTHTTIMQGRP